MSKQQFDERYPAMFQPGGEAVPAGAHWPAQPAATPAPAPAPAAAADAVAPQAPGTHQTDYAAPDALAASELPIPATTGPAGTEPADAAATSPWLSWRVPAMVGALLLGCGLLVAALPLWMARAKDVPEALNIGQMWAYTAAYTAAQAAAPMIGIGLGVLAMVLFLYVHRHPTRREGLRRLYTIATGAVLAAGIFAQFAMYTFQPVPQKSFDSVSGQTYTFVSTPVFATSLTLVAFGPLLVGFLMLAALVVTRNFSQIRMYLAGLLLVAAAVFSQFAQKIFATVPLSTQYYEGGNQSVPGWPSWLPLLMPALVAAGVIVIVCAALGPAVAAAIRAPRAVPKVEQADEENIAVEQEEDHVQPEL